MNLILNYNSIGDYLRQIQKYEDHIESLLINALKTNFGLKPVDSVPHSQELRDILM